MGQALNEMIDAAVEQVTQGLRENREIQPTWLCECGDGSRIVHVTPFGNTEEKQVVVDVMRALFASLGATSFVYVCEAWVATSPVGGDMTTPPSQRPDREEVVMFLAGDDAGAEVTRIYPLIRRAHYRKLGEPYKLTVAGFMKSRFSHMLPIRRGKQ